jgi:hypothetical protein
MRLRNYYGGYRRRAAGCGGSHPIHRLQGLKHLAANEAVPSLQLPKSVDNSNLIPFVLDQGQQGSCTGHAMAYAIWAEMTRSGVPITTAPPSPAWLYWLGRVYDGCSSDDAGSTPSSIAAELARNGFLSNRQMPYEDSTYTIEPNRVPGLARLAYDQRLAATARILSAGYQRRTDVKAALAAGYVVVFGTEVDEDFEELQPDEIWPGLTGRSLGGHCMALTGYETGEGGYVEAVNSWGDEWCDLGYCRIEWRAVDAFDDLIVVSSAPVYSGTV